MALQASVSVADGTALPAAYIRVAKITNVEKDVITEGLIYVYASAADRVAGREPSQVFTMQASYSDQPYGALYAELKNRYPVFKNV